MKALAAAVCLLSWLSLQASAQSVTGGAGENSAPAPNTQPETTPDAPTTAAQPPPTVITTPNNNANTSPTNGSPNTNNQEETERTTQVVVTTQVTQQTTEANGDGGTTSVVQVTQPTVLTASSTILVQQQPSAPPTAASDNVIEQSISVDTAGRSAVVVVEGLTTTVDASLASSVAAAASSSIAASLQNNGNDSQGSTTNVKAIAIPLGIVGGLIVLAIAGFFIWKCTKRRQGIDDDNAPIRWPELKTSDDNSFLMPAGVRQQSGHGVEFGSDLDHQSVIHESPNSRMSASLLSNPEMSSMGHMAMGAAPYYDDPRRSYYDPYGGTRDSSPNMSRTPSSYGSPDMSRRPSNLSLRAQQLPPGASLTTAQMDQRRQSGLPYESDDAQEDLLPYHSPLSDHHSSDLDRTGTVKSTHSGQKLAVVNPSTDD